jgi:predicted PhzF superfamily epimerase YddE/YHI9
VRQWTIDAFAAQLFEGNPACVLEPMADWPSAAWMQRLAQENNQAETAFLRRRSAGEYDLRWFTPAVEVPLCGHATLAAAHALAAEMGEALPLAFHTLSGPLSVSGSAGRYEMDFPTDPPRRLEGRSLPREVLGGVEAIELWAASYLVAVVADEDAVKAVAPDLGEAMRLSRALTGGRGDLVVTAKAEGRPYDVVSRFFAPSVGIAEDPATGSAHCILAPLWSARLGRATLEYFQAFPGRGGRITAEHRGERTIISGRAVTTLESSLRSGPA